jgi:CubicO group peptidase (beta-lactamase class C family)
MAHRAAADHGAVKLLGGGPLLLRGQTVKVEGDHEKHRSAAGGGQNEVEAYLREEMELNEIPGMSVAVVKSGEVVLLRAYGVRSLLTREPMTVDTPVDLASVSKSFTALGVARLLEQGGLELDAPVERYLPDFRADSRITVRHLLGQTSGLTRRADALVPCCGRPGEFDMSVAAHRLSEAKLSRAPGSQFRYANSNYVLLAALIERVSGEPFPAYMRARVFDPAGLSRTAVNSGGADYHERRWGRVRPSTTRFFGWYGASMVESTASDMARYAIAMLDRFAAPGQTPAPPYGLGWFAHAKAEFLSGTRVLEHTGEIGSSNAAVTLALDHRIGVVVLINAGDSRAGPIARGVLARVAGLPGPPAAAPWTQKPRYWALAVTALAAGILLAVSLARAVSGRRMRRAPEPSGSPNRRGRFG